MGGIALAAGFSFREGVQFLGKALCLFRAQCHGCLVSDKTADVLAGKPLGWVSEKAFPAAILSPLARLSGHCSSACWIDSWNIQPVLPPCLEQDAEWHLGSCSRRGASLSSLLIISFLLLFLVKAVSLGWYLYSSVRHTAALALSSAPLPSPLSRCPFLLSFHRTSSHTDPLCSTSLPRVILAF